jgi:hypothetical protein
VLIGSLCYKPQFGLLIPLALVAGRHWRALAAASTTVLGLCALTLLAFGPEVWEAFRASLSLTRTVVLEQGNTGWEKIQTLFSAARSLGATVGRAYGVQAVGTLACAALVVLTWRRSEDQAARIAVLVAASFSPRPTASTTTS